MTDPLDLYTRGEYTQFLTALNTHSATHSLDTDSDTHSEELLLAKGVSLLHTKQYSAACDTLLLHTFPTHQQEADIYKNTAVKCWLSHDLTTALDKMTACDYDASLRVYENMPVSDPTSDNADAMHQKINNQACCLYSMGRYNEALSVLSGEDATASLTHSGISDAVVKKAQNEYNKGIIHKKMDNFAVALKCFDLSKGLVEQCTSEGVTWVHHLHYERADTMFRVGQYTMALGALDDAIGECNGSSGSEEVRLMLLRAEVYLRLSRFDEALADLTTLSQSSHASTHLSTHARDVSLLKVFCYEKKGRNSFDKSEYKEAAGYYESSLRSLSEVTKNPTTISLDENASTSHATLSRLRISLLFNLAIAHVKLNSYGIAEQKFNYLIQLLSVSPSSDGVSDDLSVGASEDVSESIRDQYLGQAYVQLAQILMKRARDMPDDEVDDTASMKEEASDTQSMTSSHDEPNLTKIETYALAVDSLKRACALQPTNAAVVYICGVAQIRAGLLADGKRTFAAVLSLEPLHEGAKNAIDLCELCEKSLEAEELKKKQRLEEEEAEKEEGEAKKIAAVTGSPKPSASSPVRKGSWSTTNNNKVTTETTSPKPSISSPVRKGSWSATNNKSFDRHSSSPSSNGHKVVSVENSPPPAPSSTTATSSTSSSPSGGVVHPYSSLKSPGPYPAGVTVDREQYLSDEEFLEVFKVTKEDFSKFPGWKKISKRKAAGLF